jgi:GNAT superfamily N-acetyltransferase
LPAALIESDTHDSLKKYLDGSNTTRIYLLAIDEAGISLGACYIDISFLGLNNVRLGDMMIKEKYRSRGVGSKLIEEVIAYARNKKVKKIWLWTQEELKPAIQLYEKMGFILEARLIKQFCGKDALQFGLVL